MPRPPSSHSAHDVVIASPPTNVRYLRSYQDWRDGIPWTDAEVAIALREAAAAEGNPYMAGKRLDAAAYLERTGKLSTGMLGLALPFLVKSCNVCGKTALYRYGHEGRCRAHRDVQPKFFQDKRRRQDAKGATVADAEARRRLQDAKDRFHAVYGRTSGRKP